MGDVSSVIWVMGAGMIAWSGIGLYLFFLSRRQNAVSRRIRQMEETMRNMETTGEDD